jgi:hypothetical protein
VSLEPVAVSTQGLQVSRVIVKAVTVYVVYIKLRDVFWYEPTLLTFCAFMSNVWIDGVVVVNLPYGTASISTSQWSGFIS